MSLADFALLADHPKRRDIVIALAAAGPGGKPLISPLPFGQIPPQNQLTTKFIFMPPLNTRATAPAQGSKSPAKISWCYEEIIYSKLPDVRHDDKNLRERNWPPRSATLPILDQNVQKHEYYLINILILKGRIGAQDQFARILNGFWTGRMAHSAPWEWMDTWITQRRRGMKFI